MEQTKECQVVLTIKERVDKNGRRWLQDHEANYDEKIKNYLETSTSPNKYLIMEYLNDMAIGDSSKQSAKREVTKSRRLRILQVMESVDEWMSNKPFKGITAGDMKIFVGRLNDDIIVSPTQKNLMQLQQRQQ